MRLKITVTFETEVEADVAPTLYEAQKAAEKYFANIDSIPECGDVVKLEVEVK